MAKSHQQQGNFVLSRAGVMGPWSDLNSQSWVAPLTYLLTDQQITNTCSEQQTQCLEIYGCALKAK